MFINYKKILTTCFALSTILFCTPQKPPKYVTYEKTEILMGTVFTLKVFENEKRLAKIKFDTLATKAFDEVRKLEQQMSKYLDSSPIRMAAKLSGQSSVKVCDDIIYVVEEALKISEQTFGVFDISFGPLSRVWNFKHRKTPPEKTEIKNALKLVNFRNIELDKIEKTLFLKERGMSIGLGGIAKGYAAKKAGEVFTSKGYNNFIINAGGDLFVSGTKKDKHGNNENWTSGLIDPDNTSNILLRFKITKNGAVVTSGDYERFFLYNQKKYHHILDPRTGYPAWENKSVTVFSSNPTKADALATSFFILGFQKSMEIISNDPDDIAFIMITNNNEILKTSNLDKFIQFF